MNLDIIYPRSCQKMPELPDESVDCTLTSPPYFSLRDYGEDVREIWGGDPDCEHVWKSVMKHRTAGGPQVPQSKWKNNEAVSNGQRDKKSDFCLKCNAWHGQLGLEPTFQLYLDHMMIVCAEVKRVLKKTGSFWLNIGDTYGGSGGAGGDYNIGGLREGQPRYKQGKIGYQKCLLGIPWRLVLRLIDEQGFILRNCIIWEKPNSMPVSAKDRLSNSYEFLFHLVKNTEPRYYWNEKTGLMADRKPSKTEEEENVDWEWQECSKCEGIGKIIERLSKANTAERNKEPYKVNNPHLMRIKGNGKFVSTDKTCPRCKGTGKIKHTSWHSLGYYYDLDAIREAYTEPLNRWGGDKIDIPKTTKWKSDDERAKWSMSIGERKSRPNPAGKNPGDVWRIPTQPRPEAHFATFPDKLTIRPILATCPAEICKKCGKARIRITKSKFTAHTGTTQSEYQKGTSANRLALLRQAAREAGGEYVNERETIGFTDCGCKAGWDSGILLDPFAGRGTALIMAKKMGRHYVGYELSKEYCIKLIQPALDDIDPLFNRKIPSPTVIEER